MSRPWQAIGLPQITLPIYWSSAGLPLGIQLIGQRRRDEALLGYAGFAVAPSVSDTERLAIEGRTPLPNVSIRFTLKHLEYFLAAAEAQSITVAAERIHISQPSISSAIAHLETEFGARFFIRQQGHGLALTAAGQRLQREVHLLLNDAARLYASVSEIASAISGPLTIGYLTTLAPYYAARLGLRFEQLNPNVMVKVRTSDQEALFNGLRKAEIDAAITYDMYVPSDLEVEPLKLSRCTCSCPLIIHSLVPVGCRRK